VNDGRSRRGVCTTANCSDGGGEGKCKERVEERCVGVSVGICLEASTVRPGRRLACPRFPGMCAAPVGSCLCILLWPQRDEVLEVEGGPFAHRSASSDTFPVLVVRLLQGLQTRPGRCLCSSTYPFVLSSRLFSSGAPFPSLCSLATRPRAWESHPSARQRVAEGLEGSGVMS